MRSTDLQLPRAGLSIPDPPFDLKGRIALRLVSTIPPGVRERIFFSGSRISFSLQKLLQRLLGGPQLINVTYLSGPLAGRRFLYWTSEKYFIMGAAYEADALRRLPSLINPGAIVYDVGAHVGLWALFAARIAGPAGHVFAFEPSPLNFARLEAHLTSRVAEPITPKMLALSDVDGVALFAEAGTQSRLVARDFQAPHQASPVPTRRGDSLVYHDGQPPPDFVKIDIEGAAGACLSGMLRLLQHARPRLLIEIHDSEEADAVAAILSATGYQLREVEGTKTFPRHVDAVPATEPAGTTNPTDATT